MTPYQELLAAVNEYAGHLSLADLAIPAGLSRKDTRAKLDAAYQSALKHIRARRAPRIMGLYEKLYHVPPAPVDVAQLVTGMFIGVRTGKRNCYLGIVKAIYPGSAPLVCVDVFGEGYRHVTPDKLSTVEIEPNELRDLTR